MPDSRVAQLLTLNKILGALSRDQYQLLFSSLEPVFLPQGKILYQHGDPVSHCFFIMGGMISLVASTEDGLATEIGMVGEEGIVGISQLLGVDRSPYDMEVQIPGRAMRVRTEVLVQEFNRGGPFHDLILRYTHSLISQISQSAACNRFHTIHQRLCRWLLICQDRVRSDTMQLTQDALSHMLGASRTNVTAAAHELRATGLIDYHRGSIQIIDRPALEKTACECYRVIVQQIGAFRAA